MKIYFGGRGFGKTWRLRVLFALAQLRHQLRLALGVAGR